MANLNNTKNTNIDSKFDMMRKPEKQRTLLKVLAWILSFSAFIFQKSKIQKINMKGLKTPYLLLCNHNAFLDFKVATKAIFPHGANYVVAIDGFIKRESLLRKVGCICKRKFTNDSILIRHIIYSLKELKQIVVIYPEARYSLVGTNAIVPTSLGKLVKLLKVPVVTLITSGHHIDSPVWNLRRRRNPIEAKMKQIINESEVMSLDVNTINNRIQEAFIYDDYKWQKGNRIKVKYKKRAEGLHKVLYKCPACKTEFMMDSMDNQIFCRHCQKTYLMNEYGELQAKDGHTEFSHIPDWYEWERLEVRKEIIDGKYRISDEVDVDSLPNSEGYINLGSGHLTHDENGFVLKFKEKNEDKILIKDVSSMYSCHIEFEYNNKGDCIDLSTLNDTYYIYFKNLKNVVTKIHFATEELYKLKYSKY